MTEHIDKASVLKEMSTSYATLEAILASLDKTQYFIEGVHSWLVNQRHTGSYIILASSTVPVARCSPL